MNPHNPNCYSWSGTHLVARCQHPRPWRIRRSGRPHNPHPWSVWRRANDGRYVLFMRVSSFTAALQLVNSMIDIGTGKLA